MLAIFVEFSLNSSANNAVFSACCLLLAACCLLLIKLDGLIAMFKVKLHLLNGDTLLVTCIRYILNIIH